MGTINNRLGDIDIYHGRAAECRADAEQATSQNVKEPCLRAEQAWNGMATRLERHERLKEAAAAARQAQAG